MLLIRVSQSILMLYPLASEQPKCAKVTSTRETKHSLLYVKHIFQGLMGLRICNCVQLTKQILVIDLVYMYNMYVDLFKNLQ